MSKFYFNEEHENCGNKQYWISKKEEYQAKELILQGAEIEFGTDWFWCSEFGEVGLKSDSECGNNCKKYNSRNGKNGRCKFSKNCYEPNGVFYKLTEDNKIIKVKDE